MAAVHVTLREALKTRISDLLEDAQMTCHQTEESLVALAVALADYREEGVELYPRVLVCDDLTNTLRVLQGSSEIEIGRGPRDISTVKRCLKKCAPLASSAWLVWIERLPDEFRYGMFRAPPSPTAVDLRSTIADLAAGDVRALLLSQLAPGTVEIVSPSQDGVLVHMSGDRVELLPSAAQQEQLSVKFMEDVEVEHYQEPCVSFARNLFGSLLRESHGVLIAIVPAGSDVPYVLRADGTFFDAPIDIAALVIRHAERETTEAYTDLTAAASLLNGMMNSDGITVVDTTGRVLGYNCFVRTQSEDLKPSELVGGARRRAFEVLGRLVDEKALRAAFVRSTDGSSDYREAN